MKETLPGFYKISNKVVLVFIFKKERPSKIKEMLRKIIMTISRYQKFLTKLKKFSVYKKP